MSSEVRICEISISEIIRLIASPATGSIADLFPPAAIRRPTCVPAVTQRTTGHGDVIWESSARRPRGARCMSIIGSITDAFSGPCRLLT
jgi:hypothetical protein